MSHFRLPYVLLSIYFYFFAEEDLDKLLTKVREREMDVDWVSIVHEFLFL